MRCDAMRCDDVFFCLFGGIFEFKSQSGKMFFQTQQKRPSQPTPPQNRASKYYQGRKKIRAFAHIRSPENDNCSLYAPPPQPNKAQKIDNQKRGREGRGGVLMHDQNNNNKYSIASRQVCACMHAHCFFIFNRSHNLNNK